MSGEHLSSTWMALFFNMKLPFQIIQLPAKWKSLKGLYKHGALKAAPQSIIFKYNRPSCLACWQPSHQTHLPGYQSSAMTSLSIDLHLPSTLYYPPSNVFFNVSHFYGYSKNHINGTTFEQYQVLVYCPSLTPVLNLAEYRVLHCCDLCIKAKQKLHKTGADCSSIAQRTLVLMTFLVLSSHIYKMREQE